jgi:hypothetical protein
MDLAAERVRASLLQSGAIPETQLTDEEREQIAAAQQAAAQQPQEPTPEDKIAEAEIGRVQAETADVISKTQERQHKGQMEELKLMLQQQAQNVENQQKIIDANQAGQMQVFEILNTQADTLGKIKDAMGVDTIVGPSNMEAYTGQAEALAEDIKDQ